MATLSRTAANEIDSDHSPVAPRFYRPELDGLRFLAFLLVFFGHSPYRVTDRGWIGEQFPRIVAGGMFGVDLFFILSAYLITELFRREKLATGSIDIGGFYMRRILRIWPLYFAFVAVCFLARKHMPPPEVFPVAALVAFLALAGNWYIAAVQTTTHFHSPATPLWSVSVEEQFYFVWPLVARYAPKTGMTVFACLLWAASCATQFLLLRRGAVFLAVWFNSLVHGGAISIGILSAVLLEGRAPRIHKYVRVAMFLAALLLLGRLDFQFHFAEHTPVATGMSGLFCGLLAVSLLFYAILGAPEAGLRFAAWRPLGSLGRISYGLYVFHYAALDTVTYAFLRVTGSCPLWVKIVVSFPVTLLLAAISYRWFESPFLALKRRFTRVPSGAP
jgi:peptidoglycan/LPS O-acetylase OafA/YrhL